MLTNVTDRLDWKVLDVLQRNENTLQDDCLRAKDIVRLSEGRIEINSIYVTLRRMDELGLIKAKQHIPEKGKPFTCYTVTNIGKGYLQVLNAAKKVENDAKKSRYGVSPLLSYFRQWWSKKEKV